MSARKSTTRRKPASKGHMPYNDDLAQGKRTGRAIDRVRNDSDGFERFTDLMDQAYTQTPPKVANKAAAKRNRKSTPAPGDDHPESEDDDSKADDDDVDQDLGGGEQSMDFDEPYNEPQRWQPPRRDDPELSPSPPPRAAAFSFRHPRDDTGAADDSPDRFDQDAYGDAYTQDMDLDDSVMPPDDSPSAGRGTSKSARVRDPSPSSRRGSSPTGGRSGSKNSAKRSYGETEEDTAVEQMPEDQFDYDDAAPEPDAEAEPEEERPPPKKKQRKSPPPKTKTAPTKSRVKTPVTVGTEDEGPNSKSNNHLIVRQRLQEQATSDDDPDARGLRRSKRTRYGPLEWWRLEKVVYGRRASGANSVVPVIKEIIRRPQPEPEPLSRKYRRGRSKPPSSKSGKAKQAVEREPTPEDERGLDDETDPNGDVRDYVTGEIVQRRVAFTAGMVNPKPAEKNDFLFQKIFGDGDFIAAGQLVIPPGKRKPVKPSRDNSYVFYLIEGAVRFQVHQTDFLITTGGMFMAPRGNYYLIKNVASRPARIFFAQARKVAPEASVAPLVTTPRRQSGTPNTNVPSSGPQRAMLPTSKSKA